MSRKHGLRKRSIGKEAIVQFPFIKCEDDSKEFPIIDVIISLCRDKHFGEVSTRMHVAIDIVLQEDGSGSEERGISHD